jgi:hypothetical protein
LRAVAGFGLLEKIRNYDVIQASVAMSILSALLWDIIKRGTVSRQSFGPICKGQEILLGFLDLVEDETDRLSRNVGKESPLYVT